MRREPDTAAQREPELRDLELENGCILCGGDLVLRVTASGARSICRACRWISKPQMQRHGDGHFQVTHPAAGTA
jgi:hypothetical protein